MDSITTLAVRQQPLLVDKMVLPVLMAHTGPGIAASRRAGRQRLSQLLQAQFELTTTEADGLIATLERQVILVWISQHQPHQACPALLELCRCWVVRPLSAPEAS